MEKKGEGNGFLKVKKGTGEGEHLLNRIPTFPGQRYGKEENRYGKEDDLRCCRRKAGRVRWGMVRRVSPTVLLTGKCETPQGES